MELKAKLLRELEVNRGKHISGALFAEELSVSRNTIWKAIKSLRESGYVIEAAPNKGYSLISSADILSKEGINSHLRHANIFQVEVRKSVTSTNTVLRESAGKEVQEGTVLVAEEQTAGKGRQGRSFFSPEKHGVYFSVLLKVGAEVSEPALITSAAAVAVARAVEQVLGVRVGIKWVNDLFLDGKKVCGILTEASVNMEDGSIDTVVLGIGINITKPQEGYPKNLENIATSVIAGQTVTESLRCRLIAATLDNFWDYYQDLSALEFLQEYRERSTIIGHDIFVAQNNAERAARALAIDDQCRLVVRFENGEVAALSSGEVRVSKAANDMVSDKGKP